MRMTQFRNVILCLNEGMSKDHRTEEEFGASCFFAGEFREYRDLFASRCPPPMKMLKGQCPCRRGVTSGWMYYLCSGMMKVYCVNPQGNDRIVAFLKDDTIFGLDCLEKEQTSVMTIECLTDCWIMPFQSDTLKEMVRENADLGLLVLSYYCKVTRQLCQDAENLSIHDVSVRLINFLLKNWRAEENAYVRLSQEDLASAISCSRSGVARVLKKLKDSGAIEMEGIGFRIVDPEKLIALRDASL